MLCSQINQKSSICVGLSTVGVDDGVWMVRSVMERRLWDKKLRLGCARCDGAVEVAKEMGKSPSSHLFHYNCCNIIAPGEMSGAISAGR